MWEKACELNYYECYIEKMEKGRIKDERKKGMCAEGFSPGSGDVVDRGSVVWTVFADAGKGGRER